MDKIVFDPSMIPFTIGSKAEKPDLDKAAKSLHDLYSALINVGFTSDQAMTLLVTSLTMALKAQ